MKMRNRPPAVLSTVGGVLVPLVLLFASPAFAEPAGRVVSSVGQVRAIDIQDRGRTLSRHDVVYPGDLLVTGAQGRAQIRMRDDALIDLKPRSELEIEAYREASAESGAAAVMSFLRGAMRTITGRIGRGVGDVYRMDASVATMGIRGTDYSLQFCDAACATDGRPIALYGRVDDGEVVVTNEWGSDTFADGDYFLVPLDGPPQLLLMPPVGILDGSDNGDTEDGAGNGVPETVSVRSIDDADGDPIQVANGLADDEFRAGDEFGVAPISGMVGSLSAARVITGATAEKTGSDTFSADGGIVSRFLLAGAGEVKAGAAVLELVELETFTDLGVVTGAWHGSAENPLVLNGEPFEDFGSMAFAWSDNLTTPMQFAGMNGVASYSLVGGPPVFSSLGVSITINALDLGVDFDNILIGIDRFELVGGQVTRIFTEAPGDFFLQSGQFLIATEVEGDQATLHGHLVGPNAEGAIVAFDVDMVDGGFLIGGVQVLERSP